MASYLPSRDCHRCGITFTPTAQVREDWRSYCTDCRPEARALGWIPSHRNAA